MQKYIKLLLVTVILLSITSPVLASIGVGVGTGKIIVDDKLKPGQIYRLPSITVLNTGDEEAEYGLSIAYHEKQPERKPAMVWFRFDPERFPLKPGESKVVSIILDLPVNTKPGDYFAYVEASPKKKAVQGNGASIGVAAASKLYFTVVPANFIAGVYYKLLSLWQLYMPWSERVAFTLAVIVLFLVFRKYFKIELKSKKSNVSR
ncbi:MAG: hypothetical protein UT34_C0001G0022 [candidate division WS6 bacterium GW2011_GWF2_39_15]|uniref:Uncharacterized protein n=1 Tax=candidate division WS6 bacterium GW2011_GWF2_39_15 TaxID=1619100 RepID=A0A0G0QWG3_9BACT|nr:MAG: hypothetical protein UT34_C0001G0022 [candidate division WS6 bacterium GW2011_GWF2_39_15]